MQGWVILGETEQFARNLDSLIHRFVEMHGMIDTLLAQREKARNQ